MNEPEGTFELPLGMAMSIAENPAALSAFCRLTDKERAETIARARAVKTREEMTAIVNSLAGRG